MDYEGALNLLRKYNQEHLLNFYNELTTSEKENLLNDISQIDFELMNNLYKSVDTKNNLENDISLVTSMKEENIKNNSQYLEAGSQIIKNSEIAVCSMAGGQGTRLGHKGPKGTFVVDIVPSKSIFEILTDKLKSVYEKYGTYLNWYIMTSKSNNDETVKFFEDNNYFEYPKEKIKFFMQGELPLLDYNGKMLLKSKGEIFMAADGNGGIYEALYKNGILDDMHEKNIKYLCLGNVDNILIRQTDEILLGAMHVENYDLASKSIPKRSADEPVGVFCKLNNKPAVIEYSDIDKDLASKRKEDGELLYGEAHIGCNTFSLKLLDEIGNAKLPFHVAKKKNTYINEKGEKVTAEKPNTYKFEAFIFDGFYKANDILVVQGKREEEFAPIKNAEGEDSPETAKKLYENYYCKNKDE